MTFTRFPIPCRTVLAGVTAALLSTTVACGSDDGNDSADGGDTTTFSYGGVTVDIPTDPQRVVCIETRLCPEFAEITGMNLVATPEISAESAKDNVVNDELPDSVEKFEFNFNQPDPEAAANMDPDMLMTVAAWFDYYDSETQDKLEAIAPVLRISGAPDKDADWLQPLVDQAEQIGKKAEAEQSTPTTTPQSTSSRRQWMARDRPSPSSPSRNDQLLSSRMRTCRSRSSRTWASPCSLPPTTVRRTAPCTCTAKRTSTSCNADVILVQNPDECTVERCAVEEAPCGHEREDPAAAVQPPRRFLEGRRELRRVRRRAAGLISRNRAVSGRDTDCLVRTGKGTNLCGMTFTGRARFPTAPTSQVPLLSPRWSP